MSAVLQQELDIVEELQLRRWARENYVPPGERDSQHPVVAHEMRLRDAEMIIEARSREPLSSFVPLAPSVIREIHQQHETPPAHGKQARHEEAVPDSEWLC